MKQKIQVMKNKPEVSDDEIRGYMDFDRIVANSKSMPKVSRYYAALKYLVPLLPIAGIVFWLLLSHEKQEQSPALMNEAQSSELVPSTEISPPETAGEIQPENEGNGLALTEKKGEKKDGDERRPADDRKVVKQPLQKVGVDDNGYVQAEPLEGYPSLYAYFNAQLVYPEVGVKDSIEGVQTVTFIINAEGKPENIEVKQSLGTPFEKEAIRLIENMPLWKPAMLNGISVPSRISIPLTFQIRKVAHKAE